MLRSSAAHQGIKMSNGLNYGEIAWIFRFTRVYASKYLTMLFMTTGLIASAYSAETISLQDYLNRLNATKNSISNASIKCTWKSEMDGTAPSFEMQEVTFDDLGRARIRSVLEHNVPKEGADIDNPDFHETIFNGEVLAYIKKYSSLNSSGLPVKKGESPGYFPVILSDAKSALRDSLDATRNPITFGFNTVIPIVENMIEAEATPNIVINGDIHTFKATFIPDGQKEDRVVELELKVTELFCLPVSMTVLTMSNVVSVDYSAQFTFTEAGQWLPAQGSYIIWGDKGREGKPYLSWSYDVLSAKINDPRFDASIFDIVLPPEAAVSDTRHNITYRLGEDSLAAENLDKLAVEAKAFMSKTGRSLDLSSTTEPLSSGWNKWRLVILSLNVVLIAFLLHLLAKRRIKV
jgi:hypothetical protein